MPSFIIARFADDSPGDERAGAAISEVRLLVNGEYRPDIAPELVRIDARNPTAVGLNNRLTGQFQRRPYTIKARAMPIFFTCAATCRRGRLPQRQPRRTGELYCAH